MQAEVERAFAAARDQLPAHERPTSAFGARTADGFAAYSDQDLRVRFFTDLGLRTPPPEGRARRRPGHGGGPIPGD